MLPALTVGSVAYGSGPKATGSLQVLAYFPSGLLGEFDMPTGIHLGIGSLISEHALVPFGAHRYESLLIKRKRICVFP